MELEAVSTQTPAPAPVPDQPPGQAARGEASDDTPRIFWTGHMTEGHGTERKKWLEECNPVYKEEDCKVKASMPPFNNAKKLAIPDYVDQVNAPAFGPNIAGAVMRIFESKDMKDIAAELNVDLPVNTLSKFVQEKMPKVHDMVQFARRDSDLGSRMKDPIDKLEKFVSDFEKLTLNDIKEPKDWQNFVTQHVERGWESKLHFDHLLSNFGFDKDASDRLRKETFTKPDNEVVTFEQHAFRWLSKAFSAYGPEGALTDVVNAVFAMTNQPYADLSDVDISKKIDEFKTKLEKKDFTKMWIPSHLFMDAEGDDCMVWVILTYVRKHAHLTTKLKVLVQLPDDEDMKKLKESLEKVRAADCKVWLDPDARNLKAVKTAFKRLIA